MTPLTANNWRRVPATLVLLGFSVAGFLLIYLNAPLSWLSVMSYSSFRVEGQSLVFLQTQGQYWRLLTPVFLHFGWMHIVFNSLWLWELGGKLELRLGSATLLVLVVVMGVVSNTAQDQVKGPGLFGGMSGVVFGLLGFVVVYSRLKPDLALVMPMPIVGFMVGWLVFCIVVPTELLGLGSIANTAHIAGLVTGVALALAAVALQRLKVRNGK